MARAARSAPAAPPTPPGRAGRAGGRPRGRARPRRIDRSRRLFSRALRRQTPVPPRRRCRRTRRSEEHTSELQSQFHLVCRLLLEKKKKKRNIIQKTIKNQQN